MCSEHGGAFGVNDADVGNVVGKVYSDGDGKGSYVLECGRYDVDVDACGTVVGYTICFR